MLTSWVMSILKKKNIRHDITQLSNYPRISQVSEHDGSDHESPGSPVGVSGSWFGFGVRGARHSSFGTEDWKFKQKFSSIKSSQIIYQIAQKVIVIVKHSSWSLLVLEVYLCYWLWRVMVKALLIPRRHCKKQSKRAWALSWWTALMKNGRWQMQPEKGPFVIRR